MLVFQVAVELVCLDRQYDAVFGCMQERFHSIEVHIEWLDIEIAPCELLDILDSLEALSVQLLFRRAA